MSEPEITPEITVAVPHYQDLERLDRCLDALERQTVPRERFEIVVGDNASPVGEAAVLAAIAGRARMVIAGEKGAGPARNAAVAAGRGGILAFTDADCIPEPGWLAGGLAALDRYDLVGGRMVVTMESDGPKSGPEAFEAVFAFDNERYIRTKGFTVSANLFCRRDVFERTGPFLPAGVSEDLEWCLLARDAGFRLGYAPDAVVAHPARHDWPALMKKWRRMNWEHHRMTLRRRGGWAIWLLRTLAMPPSILVHAPKILTSPALDGPGERGRALAALTRLRLWRFADSGLRLVKLRR